MDHIDSASRQKKKDLRRQFQKYLLGLSELEYRNRSAQIVDRVKSLAVVNNAGVIHVYWPMLKKHEVDTRELLLWLQANKKQIVLPVVTNFSKNVGTQGRMRHVPYTSKDNMRINRWGIREPDTEITIPVEQIDLFVVPALGAGRNGFRVGHGYGYYDEILQEITVPSICLIYQKCLIDVVPFEEHDARMSVLITEHEVLHLETM